MEYVRMGSVYDGDEGPAMQEFKLKIRHLPTLAALPNGANKVDLRMKELLKDCVHSLEKGLVLNNEVMFVIEQVREHDSHAAMNIETRLLGIRQKIRTSGNKTLIARLNTTPIRNETHASHKGYTLMM